MILASSPVEQNEIFVPLYGKLVKVFVWLRENIEPTMVSK